MRRLDFYPYELIEHVTTGGTSHVYRARSVTSGAIAALKVMTTESSPERFVREASILMRLGHPHIIRCLAHGTTRNDEVWLATEWLTGEDLATKLDRGRLTVGETLVLARSLADALATVHLSGFAHRDLTPSNVFLCDGLVERAKVIDFGLVTDEASDMTPAGTLMGTPRYMPREQAIDSRLAGPRADVFSLGATLFHCLTGHAPYEGGSLTEMIAKVVACNVPRVDMLVAGVPWPLVELIARMTERSPDDRPADGAEVARELEDIEVPYLDRDSVTSLLIPKPPDTERMLLNME